MKTWQVIMVVGDGTRFSQVHYFQASDPRTATLMGFADMVRFGFLAGTISSGFVTEVAP